MSSMLPIKPLLPVLVLFFHFCLFGQESNISIDQIHELKDLNVDNHIKCLSKDNSGNLWVGADNGLYRYNGQQLNRIDISYVKDLLLTQEGELLVLADEGLFSITTTIFDWEINHLLRSHPTISDTALSYPKTIYQDIKGAIWIAENEHIIRYQNGQLNRFFIANQDVGRHLRHSFTFTEDGFSTLWAMSFNGLLYRYDRMTEQFINVELKNQLNEASELVYAGNNKLWVGTYDGIFEMTINDNSTIQNTKQIAQLTKVASIAVFEDDAMAASLDNGLFQINTSNYNSQKISSFENLDILDIQKENNRIWLASSESVFVINDVPFYTFPQTLNQFIPTIQQSKDNTFIINQGRKIYQVRKTPKGFHFELTLDTENQFWSNDAFLHQHELWMATSEGIFVYDTQNKRLSTIEETQNNAWINDIYRTLDGTIWVCHQQDEALIRIDSQRKVSSFPEQKKVRFVTENEQTSYFAGNAGSFFILDKKGHFKSISLQFEIPAPEIFDITFSKDSIYLATKKGVFVFGKNQLNNEKIKVRQINKEHVESIAIDKNETLWFAHTKGLAKLEDGKQFIFNRSQGLPSQYIIRRGLLIDHHNQLWVCTSKGLVTLREETAAYKTPPPIIISCNSNNKNIPIQDYHLGSFVHNSVISLDMLSLVYPVNSIHYQVELTQNGRLINQQITDGVVTFFGLKTGTYQLEIKAQQTGSEWSQSVIYTFSVYKKWYQTALFQILIFLSLLGLVYLLVQLYHRNLRQANEKLELLVNERTATLEAQKNELIQNQQQIVEQQKELISQNETLNKTQKALTNSEIKFLEFKRDQMRHELNLKTKQLTTHALSILQKNQYLLEISKSLENLGKNKDNKEISRAVRKLSQQIQNSIKQDDRWEEFRLYFEQVHDDFYAKLKISFPKLTNNDLKQCALVKLNLSLEDSATLLGVSSESVRISRYRIQKKMDMNSQAAFYEYLVKL